MREGIGSWEVLRDGVRGGVRDVIKAWGKGRNRDLGGY